MGLLKFISSLLFSQNDTESSISDKDINLCCDKTENSLSGETIRSFCNKMGIIEDVLRHEDGRKMRNDTKMENITEAFKRYSNKK